MGAFADFGVSSVNPSTVRSLGLTGILYFPRPNASLVVSPSTPSASFAAGQLAVPGNNSLNGIEFTVKLSGLITTGLNSTVTVILQANTLTVATPSYITLVSGTTGSLAAGTYPFLLNVELEGDSSSGIVQGYYNLFVNGARVGAANNALANSLSGISFNPAGQNGFPQNGYSVPFGLVAAVQFGSSIAGTASLYRFCIVGD